MKRYMLYTFPSFLGTPKQFRFKIVAALYAILFRNGVHELKDNKTGEYKAYWL
jgi:hypothetical protein